MGGFLCICGLSEIKYKLLINKISPYVPEKNNYGGSDGFSRRWRSYSFFANSAGVKKKTPSNYDLRIVFLSHGSRFEKKALEMGFEVYPTEPKMNSVDFLPEFKMRPGEFIGEESLAYKLIKGEIKAYQELKPDFVLYGFWPMAGIARRIVEPEIPGICFVPLPLTEEMFDAICDIPDQLKFLTILPYKIRMGIFHMIPKFIKRRLPMMRHHNLRRAAERCGWKKEYLLNLFMMLHPDLLLVNDLSDFYDQKIFPKQVVFTGPLFSRAHEEKVSSEIKKVFDPNNQKVKV
jgi:hypothetical protein